MYQVYVVLNSAGREEVGHDHVYYFLLEQLMDNDFLCKLLAGVALSLETKGKIYETLWLL